MRILAFDVGYDEGTALVIAVEFDDWVADKEIATYTLKVSPVEEYQSGQFYKRELPCILALLDHYQLKPDVIAIDGFVYLDEHQTPGLGWYLYDALEQTVPVIGVAKNARGEMPKSWQLLRGDSKKPLYISAVGMGQQLAKEYIKSMHGKFRMPALLKLADSLTKMTPLPDRYPLIYC